MSKIVFHQEAPDIVPGSFATKPKTLYLCGEEKGRIEEEPDPEHQLTEVIIANGKDGWIVNLWTKTGQHFIDPGPTHNFYAPIVPAPKPNPPPAPDSKIATGLAPARDFQVGRELAFMEKRHVSPQKVIRGDKYLLFFACEQDGYTLQLYVDRATDVPTESDVVKKGKLVVRLVYEDYEPSLPVEPRLFQPPTGIPLTESTL